MNTKKTFIILGGAELPWIYPLGTALSKQGFTTIIRLGATLSLFPQKVKWPFEENPENFERLAWNYPPGFNGKLAGFFTYFIRARLKKIINEHDVRSGTSPFIITSFPKFLPYLQDVESSKLVYLNYDDLSIAGGQSGFTYLPEEEKIVQRAGTILCSSDYQQSQFRQRFENKRASIFHMPHGVNELFIDPEPLRVANPNTVCAVGYLCHRYDWKLIHEVATKLPDVEFVFVGDIAETTQATQSQEWVQWLNASLKLSNVVHFPGLPHRETPMHFWQNAVNWMPYQTGLKFVQACCPLKLMDGIASGRPVLSADVPECRLYPEWIGIYKTADEAVGLLTDALERGKLQQYREKQILFARNNTWDLRAQQIVEIVEK